MLQGQYAFFVATSIGWAVDSVEISNREPGQQIALLLIAKLETVTLLCHCAEDAKQCHRFELQKLIAREPAAKD